MVCAEWESKYHSSTGKFPNTAHDWAAIFAAMPKTSSPRAYRRQFCQRVRAIRESLGLTEAELAEKLGISRDRLHSYERETLMPHHLIASLADISGFSVWYILTGKADSREPKSTND